MRLDESRLLDANGQENPRRDHSREEEASGGHHRRSPERDEEAEHQGVPHDAVEGALGELSSPRVLVMRIGHLSKPPGHSLSRAREPARLSGAVHFPLPRSCPVRHGHGLNRSAVDGGRLGQLGSHRYVFEGGEMTRLVCSVVALTVLAAIPAAADDIARYILPPGNYGGL